MVGKNLLSRLKVSDIDSQRMMIRIQQHRELRPGLRTYLARTAEVSIFSWTIEAVRNAFWQST
jgi:hypothetical protein